MLLGTAVGEAAFGNARPVHFALRDSHGDLGGSVLVACVVAEAHRSPWAWGPVLPGLPSARVRGILAARVLLVQRREQIVAGGLSSSAANAACRLRPCVGVTQWRGRTYGPVPNGTDGCSPSEVDGGR